MADIILNKNKYLDLVGLQKFWSSADVKIGSDINDVNTTLTSAINSSVVELTKQIKENLDTVNSYTINGTAISTSPTLTSQHIQLGADIKSDNSGFSSSNTIFTTLSSLYENIISNNETINDKFDDHTHMLSTAIVTGIDDVNTTFTGTLGTVNSANSTQEIVVFDSFTDPLTNASIGTTTVAANNHTHNYSRPKIGTTSFTGTAGTVNATNSTQEIVVFADSNTLTNASIGTTTVAANNHTHNYSRPKINSTSFTGTTGTVDATNSTQEITYVTGYADGGGQQTFNKIDVAANNHTHTLSAGVKGSIVIKSVTDAITGGADAISTADTHQTDVIKSVSVTFPVAEGNSNFSLASHTHTFDHTHNLNATFKGSASSTGSKSFALGSVVSYSNGVLTISLGGFDHTHSYTPAGTVSGSALSIGTATRTEDGSNSTANAITSISAGTISTGTVTVSTPQHYHGVNSFTPSGTIDLNIGSITMGTPNNTADVLSSIKESGSWPGLSTSKITVAKGDHTHGYTPAGNIAVTLSNESVATDTPSTTATTVSSIDGAIKSISTSKITVAKGDHIHGYTPAGSVAVTLSDESMATGAPSSTATIVSSIDGAIKSITTSTITVAKGDHKHEYTPAGTIKVTPNIAEISTDKPTINENK